MVTCWRKLKVDVDQEWHRPPQSACGGSRPQSVIRSNRVSDKKLLLLLNDRTHVLRREDELRHVGVTGRKALRQGLGKAFDLVFARKRSEGRRCRVRASPGG